MWQALFYIVFGWIWKAIEERKLPENWKALTLWTALSVGAIAGASYYGIQVVMPPAPDPVFGWVKDPEAVKAVAAEQPFAVFADTPAGKAADPLPDHMYLWQVYEKATGSLPPIKSQGSVGSCVSFGTNSAILRSYVVEAHLKGRAIDVKDIAEEVTYAGSRVEIGGGRIRGDGSLGAWGAKWAKTGGLVSREVHGKHDLTKYSESRCRAWGQSGVPDDLEPIARQHLVEEITLVKSWAEAKKALASGYAIAICSDQGFSMQRDARGVARASGSWAHCMCLDGFHTDEAGKEYGHIVNSWGPNAHTGPVGWGNPGTDGFWADASVVGRMLGQGDSWAFSSVKGWPKRDLDWFVRSDQDSPAYAALDSKLVQRFGKFHPRVTCSDFSLAP